MAGHMRRNSQASFQLPLMSNLQCDILGCVRCEGVSWLVADYSILLNMSLV